MQDVSSKNMADSEHEGRESLQLTRGGGARLGLGQAGTEAPLYLKALWSFLYLLQVKKSQYIAKALILQRPFTYLRTHSFFVFHFIMLSLLHSCTSILRKKGMSNSNSNATMNSPHATEIYNVCRTSTTPHASHMKTLKEAY